MRRLLRWRRDREDLPDAAATAETVLRAAVLLQAGVAPGPVWQHLADSGDATARAIVAATLRGEGLVEAIAAQGGAWRDVGAAWRVAATVGSPLADTLREIAGTLRDAQDTADAVRVALAEPAGTARLMGWLPLVAIGLGIALGFDTLGVLFASSVGIACLLAGLGLLVAAQRWNAALVRRAASPPGVPGLDADLLAIALSGGVSIDRARAVVAEIVPSGGASEGRSHTGPDPPDEDAATTAVLDLSRTAGVPAVELLRASATLARHRARTEGRLRAARLSSRLLLPLGVCTLPAFLLLGVAPMLLSVLSSSSLSL